jgi:hypothetical protein
MPSTAYNVDIINRAVGNLSRPQVVQALNEVCTILFNENMRQTIAVGDDGQIPTIVTVSGKNRYDMPDDVREVAYVVAKDGALLSDGKGLSLYPASDGSLVTVNGYCYRIIPTMSTSSTYDSPATVTFISDPLDATYRILYYKKAPQIEVESDPVPFPEELHRDIRACVIAMINVEYYGQTGVDEGMFQSAMMKVRNKLNKGTQDLVGRTGIQVQDYSPTRCGNQLNRKYTYGCRR